MWRYFLYENRVSIEIAETRELFSQSRLPKKPECSRVILLSSEECWSATLGRFPGSIVQVDLTIPLQKIFQQSPDFNLFWRDWDRASSGKGKPRNQKLHCEAMSQSKWEQETSGKLFYESPRNSPHRANISPGSGPRRIRTRQRNGKSRHL